MSHLFVQEEESDDELLQHELSRIEGDASKTTDLKDGYKSHKHGRDYVELPDELADDISDIELYPLIPYESDDENTLKPNIEDIRPVEVQLSLTLEFQQKVVESALITDDPFIVMGRGLGMSSIVANMLHVLATPTKIDGKLKRSLVILLNATASDNQRIGEELQELSWLANAGSSESGANNSELNEESTYERKFTALSTELISVEKRRQLYLSGGIISVSSRILIVDLLSGILHPNRVTGMVVLNVESLRNYSNESFILEIYRSKNKWSFIKGFSESPETFTMEFSPLYRRMKDLRFKNVLLWPRFRVEVSSCLNDPKYQQGVLEVKIEMTNSMLQIQFGLMECLKKCIAELTRKNRELALDWWSIENVLDINFLKSIDAIMVPNWHRISYESKQLVKDIRYLKNLLKYLFTYDAVDFFEEIQLSLDANKPSVSRKYSESPWLMADESQLVISYARKRIYDKDKYLLEEVPKWGQLLTILDDIAHEKTIKVTNGPTLIICSDSGTVNQINELLKFSNKKNGLRKLMLNKLQWYKRRREESKNMIKEIKGVAQSETEVQLNVSTTFAKEEIVTKRRRTRGASAIAAVERLKNSGVGEDIEHAIDNYDMASELNRSYISGEEHANEEEKYEDSNQIKYEDAFENMQNFEDVFSEKENNSISKETWETRTAEFQYIDNSDEIIVERFSNANDDSFLQETRPSYIIMFEPNLSFIRRIEVYRAICGNMSPKIFFMYYGESVEEQSHLTAIKREKDAFTKLIRENALLASHYEADEDLSHFKNLAERKMKLNKLNKRNTRNAGGQSGNQRFTQDIVIVDTREFSASLPGLLFRYGVRVIPCMLSVGDYIISPDICIERKSISDLIGSLQNNRLVTQCKKMLKYYKYVTLLIEFDEGQSFSLEPFSERRSFKKQDSTTHPISNKLSQDEIQQKLAKLVLQFPTLKIIWASSPLQSVNIILELKLGREQPDPSIAVSYGTHLRKNAKPINIAERKNKSVEDEDFTKLLKIPGFSKIDYFNIRKKIKHYGSLKKMKYDEILDIVMDDDLTGKIYKFIQQEIEDEAEDNEEQEEEMEEEEERKEL